MRSTANGALTIYLALSQEDIRNRGDDATVVLGRTEVQFAVDPDDQTAADLRRLAAELMNAADELDRVTGAGSDWTEDDL